MKKIFHKTCLVMIIFTIYIGVSSKLGQALFYAATEEQYSVSAIDEYLGEVVYSKTLDSNTTSVIFKSTLDENVYNLKEFETNGYTYSFEGWYDEKGNNVFDKKNYILITDECTLYAKYNRKIARDTND